MQSNVIGRVQNTHLPKSHSLLPLFEAIINSVDAIEEFHDDIRNGIISIYINRIPALLSSEELPLDQRYKDPIQGFTIIDNGKGFTFENFRAFNEADSLNKANKGGKGVGRFIWLKAFSSVKVKSVYEEDNDIFERKFTFSLKSPDGISEDTNIKIEKTNLETTIVLDGFSKAYESNCPKNASTIAQRIVEHCLSYFLLTKMPKIFLYDSENEVINLWNTYSDLVDSQQKEEFQISKKDFDLIHFRLQNYGEIKHHICLCANGRVVKSEQISSRSVPNLPSTIIDNESSFVYAGYLLSDFLDKTVNQYRTDFDIFEDGELSFTDLSYDEIYQETLKHVESYLSPFTEIVRQQKLDRIVSYVNEEAPQYRHVIKHHPEKLDQIPADVSDNKLDSLLYEISRDIEKELRTDGQSLLKTVVNPNDEKSQKEYSVLFDRWWNEYNDVGKANLAQYILHRRIILELLEKSLNMQDTGKYSKEEAIHKIIFPLHSTSDDVLYEQHNLWVLDEKLAYHHYLASDIPLKSQEFIESKSNSRPDLILYNRSIAVVNEDAPYHSGIVIFEFKRPLRDDFDSGENPIIQVYNYITEIRNGKAKKKDGGLFNISSNTPFYCYIVCDITPTLRNQAEIYDYTRTPDGSGYYGYNKNLGAYIEIIGFEKLLVDAKKRNRILFDKLNMIS
jgi:hypothetical protein